MKKLLSIILSICILSAMSVTAFAAPTYSTKVVYKATLNIPVDLNNDETTDEVLTDEIPFYVIVPEVLTYGGIGDNEISFIGLTTRTVTLSVPKNITMFTTKGNKHTVSAQMIDTSFAADVTKVNANSGKVNITPQSEINEFISGFTTFTLAQG